MLDIIESPSFKNLRFDANDNMPERAARLSSLLQSDASRTLCFHDEKLFCKIEDTNQSYLLYLKSNSEVWESVDQLPFGCRIGQSMTSTFSGMAFFGGANNTTFYNDLWIYMSTTEWFTVPTYIPARKNHAATCDTQGHLIIYGGTGPNGAFNDLYMIDITTQEVKEIQLIDNSPLPRLVNHSMTLLNDGTFFLYGKIENNLNANYQGAKHPNTFTYMASKLDIENRTLIPINTDFENAVDSVNYYTSYIYDLVFLFGLTQNQPIWMFDLTNNTWIPFSMPKTKPFRPLYLFISESFSQKKSIHIMDNSLSQIATIPVFTSSPPDDLHESPQYIHFLKSHLKKGCKYFDNLKVQYNTDSEKLIDKIKNKFEKQSFVNDYLTLFENCDLSEDLEKKAEKISAMMNLSENQFNISLTNLISKNSLLSNDGLLKKDLSVYEILSKTNEIRKKGKEEILKLSQEAEELSQQVDQTSFLTIFNNFNPQQPQQQQRVQSQDFIKLYQKSRQLANEIQFEQTRLAEEQKKFKSLGYTKKDKILNIRYQIWSVTQDEYQKVAHMKDLKKNFFNTVADIYALRHQELLINDPNVRTLAENYIQKPDIIAEMKKAQENLKNIKTSFSALVDDLGLDDSLRQEDSYSNKLSSITKNLNEMNNWVNEVNTLLSEPSNPKILPSTANTPNQRSQQNRQMHRSMTNLPPATNLSMVQKRTLPQISLQVQNSLPENNEYFTRFSSCIGNSGIYLKDLQKVLSKIEKDVDIFNF